MTASWIERVRETRNGERICEQERLVMQATEAIAEIMESDNVSRTELARRLGKSPAFVTKLLRGHNNFTLRTLSDVLFALNRSVHLSLGEIGEDISLCKTQIAKPLNLDSSRWGKSCRTWPSTPQLSNNIGSDGVAA